MRRMTNVYIRDYIAGCFIGITVITAVLMMVFITYSSNAAIKYDRKSQIRSVSKYDNLYISENDGKIEVSDDFSYEENGIVKVVLDKEGNLLSGEYINDELETLKLDPKTRAEKTVREVKCDNNKVYYVYDRYVYGTDLGGGSQTIAVIRSMAEKKQISSVYRTLKYASYICGVGIILLSILLSSVFARHIVEPIKQICDTAEKIGINQDLSKRISYDGRFKEIQILADANNRMLDSLEEMFEQQKQFTSDVTHELRTPVAVILAQCEYTKKHIHDQEEFDEAIDLIERQVRKTNSIIMRLLQLSRLDQERIPIEFEYVDLRDIVEEVCENEKLKEPKNVELRLHMEKAEANIDVGLMMIAISNIVNNAIKYSEENTAVDITLFSTGDTVELVVQDYGCGMNENDVKHIFDRFYRADKARNSEGFGLGLSLATKIVELHSGRILATSKEKEGSIFRIILPGSMGLPG
ncbi:MAG: HAMP domain-containing histidine kinase [Clostridiales bacterium]|nr:HAMP domain-containing histidine kinase [Clostridiales bacterium]